MPKPKMLKIKKDEFEGLVTEDSFVVWERRGWTVVDDGDSESDDKKSEEHVDTVPATGLAEQDEEEDQLTFFDDKNEGGGPVMARIIPNENTWVGFAAEGVVTNINSPTAAMVTGAVDLTPYVISLNASSRGNTVPTPAFDSLFETSTAGTSAATFDADFYRDDEDDEAWETLTRGTRGFFIISRFGGAGTGNKPIAADKVEVWPVMITSRTMANMSSNTVLTFTVSCSVNVEPAENATVAS